MELANVYNRRTGERRLHQRRNDEADRIRAGLLTDEVGANYWDLETGEFQLSPNAKYGDDGWTVDGVIEDLHSGMTQNGKNIEALGEDFQTRNKELDETISSLDKTV